MHQGRSESASSSYLQGTIRRGQTRIPQHTVSTSNSYFIHLQMLNAGYCRQRLRVRCYIELSAYFKSTLVSCCLFVAVCLVVLDVPFLAALQQKLLCLDFVYQELSYLMLPTSLVSFVIMLFDTEIPVCLVVFYSHSKMLRELIPPDLSRDQSPDDWKRVCYSRICLVCYFSSIIF